MIQKKVETQGREFAKNLRSLDQFLQQWKVRTILVTECFFNLFLEVFSDLTKIGKKHLYVDNEYLVEKKIGTL